MSKEAPKCKFQQKIYQTETLALISIHIIIATQNLYIQTERNNGYSIGCKPFKILVAVWWPSVVRYAKRDMIAGKRYIIRIKQSF
jgi:hypothetical protein